MRHRRRSVVRAGESQPRNSTTEDNSGDNNPPALAAFVVWLEIPDEVVKIEVAGLDKFDAATRARWAVHRERRLRPDDIRVIDSKPADAMPAESPAVAS